MTPQKSPTSAPRQSSGVWSYLTGEKGRNRVRVYERPPFGIWIDYRTEDGGRVRHSLKHNDRDQAKRDADEVAAQFSKLDTRPRAALTLFDIVKLYQQEVTPHKKSDSARGHDRRTLSLFLEAFGDRRPETLNVRDWNAYIRRRQSGELAPPGNGGKAVRSRVIEQDLKLLLAVLNWAERARSDGSGYLLDRNPLRGLKVPKEENPQRPMFNQEQLAAVLEAAAKHSPLAERFVMLAWYTGHRSGAIRQLRWSDVDVDAGVVTWRADTDKIGYAHQNPMHTDLQNFLQRDRARVSAIAELTGGQLRGDAWLFPNEHEPTEPISREFGVKVLWPALRTAAGIPAGRRFGWHSFRRAFAHSLRDVPLRELKDLGGWKNERTVVAVYLQPDEGAQRKALERI